MSNRIKSVAFFGFADAKENDQVFKDAFQVAKVLAKSGYTIVNGAGPGVMRAASEGAKKGGGKAIGVTFFPKDISIFEGRDPKNPVDKLITKEDYLERTEGLLREGDAYVIFNGGTGTISEFGMAWGLARLYFGHHKPLILYGKFWNNVIGAICANMMIRPEEMRVYKIVKEPEEVLKALEKFKKALAQGEHWHRAISEKGFQL